MGKSYYKETEINKLVEDLYREAEQEIGNSFRLLAEELRNKIIVFLEDWYGTYEPETYQREKQIIECLDIDVKKWGKFTEYHVFFNPEKLQVRAPGTLDNWYHYANQETGEDEREIVPFFIEDGWGTKSGWKRKGAHSIDKTYGYMISGKFQNLIKSFLSKDGYNVSFK